MTSGGGGFRGPPKEWKRCKRMNEPYWGMSSSSLDAVGFVSRGKIAICGFMFGKEQYSKDFTLKV